MPKKELPTTIRQMHGYEHMADQILAGTPHLKKLADDLAKDKLIAELRAKIAKLEMVEARETERLAKEAKRIRNWRAKRGSKTAS